MDFRFTTVFEVATKTLLAIFAIKLKAPTDHGIRAVAKLTPHGPFGASFFLVEIES